MLSLGMCVVVAAHPGAPLLGTRSLQRAELTAAPEVTTEVLSFW